MTHPVPGAPDYFAMFQSMFTPPGSSPAPAQHPLAMLDPKELERKIAEMETVLTWLRATTGMVEVSISTMKYQQSMLASFGGAGKAPAPAEAPDFARMAEAMNPALWAFNMMQAPGAPPATPTKPKAAKARKRNAR